MDTPEKPNPNDPTNLGAHPTSADADPVPEREIVMENGFPVVRLGLASKIPYLTNEQIAELLD